MSYPVLVVGGIEIPFRSSHDLRQNYTPQQAVSRVRMMNGSLTQQSSWRGKLLTQIRGEGLVPSGLQLLDWSQPITIKCIAERAVTSSSNVIDVDANRRSDYGVIGRALVGNALIDTPVSVTGNTATLTTVAGATAYQAYYWPELVCYSDGPEETRGARTADYGWTLIAEEI